MSTTLAVRPSRAPTWRERRRSRRELARQDRRSAALAELSTISSMLAAAQDAIRAGWVQNAWYAYRDDGILRAVHGHNLDDLTGQEINASCLVGAIVTAGGGVDAVDTQPVQRALDLTWHTLWDARYQPTAWSPNPVVRLAHLRDLTAWNDDPRRTRDQVLALLRATEQAATRLRTAGV
ncbi:MAG TPA: hypothetical protein VIW24_04720 [Aldersonia sp.]